MERILGGIKLKLNKINQSLWDKLLVSEEASGNPASFDDGADDVPVSSLKVALEPIQLGSGDPSPSNIRPIYPANGKNYLDTATTTSDYITYTQGADYYITASPSNSDTRGWSYANCQYKFTLPAGTYKFVWDVRTPSTMGGRGFRVYKSDSTILADGYGATLDTNGASSAFTLNESTNVGVILKQYEMVARFMIVRSTESNVYVPYQGIMVDVNGKNLLKNTGTSKTENGITWTLNADGSVKCVGTATGNSLFVVNTFNFVGGTPYMLTGCPQGGASSTKWQIQILSDLNSGATKTETGTGQLINDLSGSYYVRLVVRSGNTVDFTWYPMIRLASDTDSTFAPYIGTSYPYTLGRDVYGGTVDLATGVLTVTHGIVTDYSALSSNGTSSTGAYRYKLAVAGVAGFTIGEAMCNMLKFEAGFNDDAGEFYNATDVFNIFLADSTVASAITTLTGCQIVYPLATPQTIQLTPQEVKTLLGYNNISSSGTVEVIYHADTKLYVDKLTNVDNNIIAPTEADFVATRNYTVNDLVIVNDTLYKCTANIASGSAITPNSNVTATTLATLIKALS